MSSISRLCTVCIVSLILCTDALAWGQKGHDIVCTIAQNHLNAKARKEVKKLLEGRSMVYWSNWLDNASHTPQYAYTKTWHYKNVDAGMNYEDAVLESKGDVVTAVYGQIQVLKDNKATDSEKALALKMLIHLVGDLHQPLHMGHKTDLGGNLWPVTYFSQETNLHAIWDTNVLEDGHKWSHTEWAREIDVTNKSQRREISKGTIHDWAKETLALTTQVYDATPQNANLSYDYLARWTPVIEKQLLRGGVRLAHLLNEIF